MLAERARLKIVVALSAAALAGTIAFALRPRCEPKLQRTDAAMTEMPAREIYDAVDFCPPHVRAAIHLGTDATLHCVRGQFPEPGTFVFAQYRTTENWERFAVVADDGQLIVPMLERPAGLR